MRRIDDLRPPELAAVGRGRDEEERPGLPVLAAPRAASAFSPALGGLGQRERRRAAGGRPRFLPWPGDISMAVLDVEVQPRVEAQFLPREADPVLSGRLPRQPGRLGQHQLVHRVVEDYRPHVEPPQSGIGS
jgi:hypothetical protein